MLNQFEDLILTSLVDKLNAHGIQIDLQTIKNAVANSPQLIQQIESILSEPNSENKIEKIKTLISQATK